MHRQRPRERARAVRGEAAQDPPEFEDDLRDPHLDDEEHEDPEAHVEQEERLRGPRGSRARRGAPGARLRRRGPSRARARTPPRASSKTTLRTPAADAGRARATPAGRTPAGAEGGVDGDEARVEAVRADVARDGPREEREAEEAPAARERVEHGQEAVDEREAPVWKSTAGSGGLSSSVASKSIQLILGRIDGSRRVEMVGLKAWHRRGEALDAVAVVDDELLVVGERVPAGPVVGGGAAGDRVGARAPRASPPPSSTLAARGRPAPGGKRRPSSRRWSSRE